MAEKKRPKGPFTASFIYTDEILEDFMAVYLIKKQVHPGTRVVCAAGGLAGILYFGYALYTQGMSVARQFCKKRYTTRKTRIIASKSVFTTSSMEILTNIVVS